MALHVYTPHPLISIAFGRYGNGGPASDVHDVFRTHSHSAPELRLYPCSRAAHQWVHRSGGWQRSVERCFAGNRGCHPLHCRRRLEQCLGNQHSGRARWSGRLWPPFHCQRESPPFFRLCGLEIDSHTGILPQPDLPLRVKEGLPLTPYNRDTFYTLESAAGYIDYPFINEVVSVTA